jgi:hypothetical protein
MNCEVKASIRTAACSLSRRKGASLHSDLSNFDRMEIGIHPQAPQRLH